jgi:S1-C subfamily serine protease
VFRYGSPDRPARASRRILAGLLCGLLAGTALAAPAVPPPPAPLSDVARRLYEDAHAHLLQIRIVVKDRGTQASAGSGFVVAANGLIVTNYHVISALALEPEKFRVLYQGTDGSQGDLTLLAIDLRHDLAVLKATSGTLPAGGFAWSVQSPRQGDRLYSMGNPLDIGFAVVEGTYNGVPPRSFYPQMLFTGAINPGMSGGPVVDAAGRLVGVNVAKHVGGELVSFLVPARFAQTLVADARVDRPLPLPAHAEATRQLLQHQSALVAATLASPLPQQTHGHWRVPQLAETYARCWGNANSARGRNLLGIERADCTMDTALFTGLGDTGTLSLRYEIYDGTRLGSARFYRQYSASLANEKLPAVSRQLTQARCREDFVDLHGLPMRVAICARAHRKFSGLYDFSIIASALDDPVRGVQSRLDAYGVSFANGMALARHYLKGFEWAR